MRTCKSCGIEKPVEEFYQREYIAKDGPRICHSHTCKRCSCDQAVANRRARWTEHYKDYHKKFYSTAEARDARVRYVERMRAKIDALKAAPCLDCGRSFPAVCMDFDHRDPSQKDDSISQLVAKRRRWGVIKAEIDKCDLVCACCHRIRTAKMLGYFTAD